MKSAFETGDYYDGQALLSEFISNPDDYSPFAPPTKAIMLQESGAAFMHGGMLVYAAQNVLAGVKVMYVPSVSLDDSQKAAAAVEFMRRYPSDISPMQKRKVSRIDTFAVHTIEKTSQQLIDNNRRVMGSFMLLSTDGLLRIGSSDTYITGFISKLLPETLRFAIRDTVLKSSRGDAKRMLVPEAATNQLDLSQVEQFALHIMAGLLPPEKQVHRLFGLKRKPRLDAPNG